MQQCGWPRLRTREGLRAAGVLSLAWWRTETQNTCDMGMLSGCSCYLEGLRASGVLGMAAWLAETMDTGGMCMLALDRNCYLYMARWQCHGVTALRRRRTQGVILQLWYQVLCASSHAV